MAKQNQQAPPQPPPDPNKAAVVAAGDNKLVQVITDNVMDSVSKGTLHLPPNYSAQNALKKAWLKLQNVEDKNHAPALQVTTKASQAQALMDMVIQGLDPGKEQCYFIVYGNQLQCQRSYHGSMAVAQRVTPEIDDFYAAVVYAGDKFRFKLKGGGYEVIEHEQTLENIADPDDIIAAYCVAVDAAGNPIRTEIMDRPKLEKAWRQSKMNPFDENGNLKASSFHAKFTDEAARKTVINRLCKRFINKANDESLNMEAFQRTSEENAEEREASANGEVIDTTASEPNGGAESGAPAENPEADPPPAAGQQPKSKAGF